MRVDIETYVYIASDRLDGRTSIKNFSFAPSSIDIYISGCGTRVDASQEEMVIFGRIVYDGDGEKCRAICVIIQKFWIVYSLGAYAFFHIYDE